MCDNCQKSYLFTPANIGSYGCYISSKTHGQITKTSLLSQEARHRTDLHVGVFVGVYMIGRGMVAYGNIVSVERDQHSGLIVQYDGVKIAIGWAVCKPKRGPFFECSDNQQYELGTAVTFNVANIVLADLEDEI